jgi:hypothetical protein
MQYKRLGTVHELAFLRSVTAAARLWCRTGRAARQYNGDTCMSRFDCMQCDHDRRSIVAGAGALPWYMVHHLSRSDTALERSNSHVLPRAGLPWFQHAEHSERTTGITMALKDASTER